MAEFRIEIAGKVFAVRSLFDSTKDYCHAYLTDADAAFSVAVTREDIAFEQRFLDEEADEEGFHDLAEQFRQVALIEKSHEERYRKLLDNVEMQKVFEKAEETMWECRNCGHLVIGKKAPEVCPVCAHPKAYFEVRAENY